MCGIVGYIGERQAQPILVEGLRKLEYRGYDSAGICVFDGTALRVRKTAGRLSALEEKLAAAPLPGTLGIGHTRWATHGRPTNENAHPHTDAEGRFAVVHNGIIENFQALRERLVAKGYRFVSETDTETIAHLLADLYDGDFVGTVRRAVAEMKGAYALAIVCRDEPDKLVVVRQASPLVIGVGKGEQFVASDIPALLEHTRDVYILENGEMAVLTKDGVTITKTDGTPVARDVFRVTWDLAQAEKEGYAHFMLKEIHEQPKAIRDTLSGRLEGNRVVFPDLKLSPTELAAVEKIHIVACGTAYHAGLVGKAAIERLARVPVDVEVASEYRYRDPLLTEKTLVIVISQSGETADTLAALRESQRRGAKVLGIVNVVGSSVAREADDVLFTWAGPEIAVASTKAYTAQLVVLYLFALYLAELRGTLSEAERAGLVAALQALPEQTEAVLGLAETMKGHAESVASATSLFFIGRGLDYAVAQEGSLKLKEISYIHSEAYAAGELKHGTLALIEDGVPVVALATQPNLLDKMVSNITEVKARGARVIALAMTGEAELAKTVDDLILLPPTDPLLAPVLAVVPLQLFAYHAAVARGLDVDKPRNLAKSVTVE
ncbi:glutamine--fructose-6-phosphate transaminase (isomerizing) [Calditerricola satsumensis]|uniref:Glutamine--fructose-6-phosphate aminotransferase [isomerizing] n=1 Tax=Calditerricola satsumensis TaxID=373054 RepID=A0A8J3BD40_9BACI|nr:glutamine--fructose-6-phosphate transaminase (isomerizing) [Calditerricola satsumensis]GGJ98128.1 glutamine--fructose-6-phosphate aminotransferase [isomerizing] [Calditerricola satsumensis]